MAAVMNVNEETLMRERVPLEMQGRVFSAKSTLQNFTIPPALLLGGLLADTIFEPFMMTDSPAQQALSGLFGTGKGAGIGMMFLIVGIAGMLISFTRLQKPVYRELDRKEPSPTVQGVAAKMTELLNAPKVPAIAKVRILEIILERTYGKAETAIKVNADVQSNEAARARLEAIAARIRVEVD